MDIVPILSTIILIATIMTLIIAVASYIMFRMKEKRKGQFKTNEEANSSIVAGSSLSPELKEIRDLQRGIGTPSLQPVPHIGGVAAPVVLLGNAPTIPSNRPNIPGGAPPAPTVNPVPQPNPTVINVNYPTQPTGPSVPQQPHSAPQVPQIDPSQQPYPAPNQQQPPQQTPQYSNAQSSFMNSLKVSGGNNAPGLNDQPQAGSEQSSFRRFQVPQQNQPAPDQPPPKSKNDEAVWK